MISPVKLSLGAEEIHEVERVIKSGMVAQGPEVKKFEEEFASFTGTKHAVAVNSGTAALHTSLYALGVKKDDEVIMPPFTFIASANSVIMQGGKPVFADVKEDTFNIDADLIEEKITEKTKAIMPVHLFGQIADMDKIMKIAKKNSLIVVEDACQAHGAELNGKSAGSFSEAGTFSLYATKNMTTAEGGIISTDDEQVAEMARRFRHHGQSEATRYEYFDIGYNYRMTDITAAIGRVQLRKLPDLSEKRINNAKFLSEGISKIPGLIIPSVKKEAKHVFHQYTIRVTEDFPVSRDELRSQLSEKGIGSCVFYPKPLHLSPWLSSLGWKKGDFPVSERLSQEVLCLPVHPFLSGSELEKIVDVLGEIK